MEYFPTSKTRLYQPPPSFIRTTLLKNFFRKQQTNENDPRLKTKIALVAGFKKFFLSFFLVSCVFAFLQAWLTLSAYSNLSQQTALEIETHIHWLKERIEPFEKYKFFPELVLIALLIGLASLWPIVERLKLKNRYKKLMKGLGFVTGLLTIAVCFTFYGNRFEKGEKGVEGELKIHELRILENNKLLIKEVQTLAEKNVVDAFVNSEKVKNVVANRESANKAVDSLRASPEYTYYSDFSAQVVNKVDGTRQNGATGGSDGSDGGVGSELNGLMLDDNVVDVAGQYEKKFDDSYAAWRRNQPWAKQAEPNPDNSAPTYFQDLAEDRYESFVQSGVVREKEVSESAVASEQAVLDEVKLEWPAATTPLYEKYGEIIEKTIDKTYNVTFKGWINGAAEAVLSSVPLIGELLDPVHDMVKDMINEKFKKLLAALGKKNKGAVIDELNTTAGEMNSALEAKSVNYSAWDRLHAQAVSVRGKLVGLVDRMRVANARTRSVAESYLEKMKRGSRWQAIRERFAQRARFALISHDPPGPFTSSQWEGMQETLGEWDQYMNTHKESWLRDGIGDLEKGYYDFLRGNPRACGAWGFILQQEDWDGAVTYYTVTAPDAAATGKPYYLLKYYCASINNGNIEQLYTKAVEDQGVGRFCPH
jgi:hypothetical protein